MYLLLLLRRISKLSARRDESRFFSTLPLSPYLKLSGTMLRQSPEGYVVDQRFFDPKTVTEECISEKTVPIARQFLTGASKGWILGLKDEDSKVSITDLYKPWVSSPRVISLPSLGKSVFGHGLFTMAASFSSSDPVLDDNFFVAAIFRRDRLSLLRSTESSWTHVESEYLPATSITYSKRDKVFYFTSSMGIYLGILDLIHREIKYHFVCLRNLPKLSKTRWNYLNKKCILTNHVVESPSGELFFIMWYTQCSMYERESDYGDDEGDVRIERIKPKRFLVFREDEKSKEFWYTENIGDLCIFLGNSEAFCVSASMYPGLIPNSIYYVRGPGLGCYNLASAKPRALSKIDGNYWIEPVA